MTQDLLLDTNILSELTKKNPNPNVLQQFERASRQATTSAITLHELRYGIGRMPAGRRREEVEESLACLKQIPVIPYDAPSAILHARIRVQLEQAGTPIAFVDGQIAAIALRRRLTLVTRNIRHFQSVPGLRLENWFEPPKL